MIGPKICSLTLSEEHTGVYKNVIQVGTPRLCSVYFSVDREVLVLQQQSLLYMLSSDKWLKNRAHTVLYIKH